MQVILKTILVLMAILPFQSCVEGGVFENLLNLKTKLLPPKIKVLVVYDRPGVVVEVKGKYRLYDPNTKSYLSTRFLGKRKYIQALRGGLQWGEEFPGLFQLQIEPDDQSITTIVDGVEYRGSIVIYDVEGTISVVNEVFIEDYLASLLSPQVRNVLPEEVLAAIAITARTNAYCQVANPKSPFWDVDGKKIGYHGYAVTDGKNPIEKAIYATRYLVMSRSNADADQPIPFLGQFGPAQAAGGQYESSHLSLDEAEAMASKGNHAAQILAKAFPNTSMKLMHYSDSK